MVKVLDGPSQSSVESYAGVTSIIAVTGSVVSLVALKDAIFPVPPDPSPIDVSLLVHVYNVVPVSYTHLRAHET